MLKVNMLIVISDLHFSDGTSSQNISHRAFLHFFQHIKNGMRDENKEIIIVFAGDTFDLLRSEYWMTVDDNERPWGDTTQKTDIKHQKTASTTTYQKHINAIFDRILSANQTSLEMINQTADLFYPVPVRIYLIPGNHDRMLVEVNDYNNILKRYIGNIEISEAPYKNDDYGIKIRHGHEFDAYNFESDSIPIGDINTTELFVYLPYKIKLQYPDLADELCCVEDIRPQWRIFDYLASTYPEGEINRCITKETEEAIERYFRIPSVKSWIAAHDTASPVDDADKLEFMLRFFKFLPLSWAKGLLKTFSYFEMGDSHYEDMAEKEDALYVVYGHTHSEKVSMLGIRENLHSYYVNTGTWRERIVSSKQGVFSRYKTLTYAVFYTKDERHTTFPSFELWNGMLRE